MKKITLSVAALSIAMMSYGQCTTNPIEEECKIVQYGTMHLIDAIRKDLYYGRISEQVAGRYLQELLTIQRNSISLVNTINQSQLAFDEEISDYLQETLTTDEWFELTSKLD